MIRTLCLPGLLALACLPALAAPAAAPDDTVKRILHRMDRDNDGKVGYEEYRNAMVRRFHAVDANGDGRLEAGEVPKEWIVVDASSLGEDGIDLSEFGAHMRASFSSFDADHDGKLDQAELAALAQARAAKLGETK